MKRANETAQLCVSQGFDGACKGTAAPRRMDGYDLGCYCLRHWRKTAKGLGVTS